MNIEFSTLLQEVLSLEGDQKIFIKIHEEFSKHLRFIDFQRSALENTVLSYINLTTELANEANFNKFIDRIAQLTIDKEQATDNVLTTYLPEELAAYLASPAAEHNALIDSKNNVIILSHNKSSNEQLHSCERHYPGQEHEHSDACEVDHNHGHDHDHNHSHNH